MFSPDTKTETLKPLGTMMSWPWPGSKKTISVGQRGLVTVGGAALAPLVNTEATTPPAKHPRSLALVFDNTEYLRTRTSLAVARFGLVASELQTHVGSPRDRPPSKVAHVRTSVGCWSGKVSDARSSRLIIR